MKSVYVRKGSEMKKSICIAVTLLVASPVYAEGLPTYNPEEIADQQLATLDADHSSTIDGAEFERASVSHFNKIDSDGNGMLSGDEMFNFRYADRPDILNSSTKSHLIENIMKRWDTNKDMQISLDEKLKFRRAEFRFIDRDENESITREELVAHWQRKKVEMESSRNRDSKSK